MKTVGLQVNVFYPFVFAVQVKMSAVFALGFTFITCVSALSLTQCDGPLGKKAIELRENVAQQTVTCDGTGPTGQVQWRYVQADGTYSTLVTCSSPSSSSCTADFSDRFATGTRSSTSSTLTFVTQASRAVHGARSVICFMTAATEMTCQLDVVYPSDVSTPSCSITNDWKIQCSCNVTKAFSTRDRYSCQWFQKTGGQISLIPSASSTVTSPTIVDTDYKRFDCSFSIDLPAVTGAYSYDVKVFPGDVTERAANTIDVVRPSAPTITTCSPNGTVPANTAVSCTCTTGSLGQPLGRLKWVKVADGSQISVGGYGSTTLQITPQTLTLSDHDAIKFRCDVDWVVNITGEGFRASVGYPPSQISLTLNGNQGNEVVHETQRVTFDCAAGDGQPTPTVRLVSRANGTAVHGELSPLTYSVMARCEDSGVYVCTARNGMGTQEVSVTASLTVQCSPRGDEDVGEVTFHADPVSVRFDVTAFPTPTEVNFTLLGSSTNATGSPQTEPDGIRLEGVCGPHKAVVFRSTCFVIVSNTQRAAGLYRVTVTNTQGSAHFRLQVKYKEAVYIDTTTDGATAELQSYFGVAVALGVVLAVIVIVNVIVIVLWLKRRHWVLPCADAEYENTPR